MKRLISNGFLYSKMDLEIYVQLILLCVLNIVFFFSGVILNTLVIITIFKVTQLRKKLCHFMIMVLSCSDLLSVLTFSSGLILLLIARITGNYHLLVTKELFYYERFSKLPVAISMNTLLVMCIERYLGVYYPIFHKTSVTRRRLLTLFTVLCIIPTAWLIVSLYNHFLFLMGLMSVVIYNILFAFLNYKLFMISRKMRSRNATISEKRRRMQLKHINTCLLSNGCFVLPLIPTVLNIVMSLLEGTTATSIFLSYVWANTFYAMNCSFNCLIFFWKNRILRSEGIKIIRKMKDRVFWIISTKRRKKFSW